MIIDLVSGDAIEVKAQVNILVPEVQMIRIENLWNRTANHAAVIIQYGTITINVLERVKAIVANAIKLQHIESTNRLTVNIAIDGRTCLAGALGRASSQHLIGRIFYLVLN